MRFFLEESFGIRGNLSPLALAKNKGTEVFRLVPLRGEVSESVPLFQKLQQKKETEQIVFLIKPSFFFLLKCFAEKRKEPYFSLTEKGKEW